MSFTGATRRSAAVIGCSLALAAATLSACTGKDAVSATGSSPYRYIGTTSRGTTIPEAKRKLAENITGTLMDGKAFSLAGEKGKVVVLNFWASWCPPCQSESPGLDTYYRRNNAKGFTIVGLDVKDPIRDHPVAFLKDNDISYPIVYDPNGKTAIELGQLPVTAVGLPWTVVLDKQQRVAAVYNGQVLPKDLDAIVPSLLAES